jgi:hypothetical protein
MMLRFFLKNKAVIYNHVLLSSIGKRIFAMVFLNFRASKVLDKLYLAFSNNLHYKMNDLSQCLRVMGVR